MAKKTSTVYTCNQCKRVVRVHEPGTFHTCDVVTCCGQVAYSHEVDLTGQSLNDYVATLEANPHLPMQMNNPSQWSTQTLDNCLQWSTQTEENASVYNPNRQSCEIFTVTNIYKAPDNYLYGYVEEDGEQRLVHCDVRGWSF